MKFTETDLQALAARVEKLEAQNHGWKAATIAVALVASSLVMMGAKPADRIEPPVIRATTVEAQDFVLKDEDGQVRARLTINPGIKKEVRGGRILMMNPATVLGPALQFYDEKGNAIWTAPADVEIRPVK